ncbi:MAG: hypothetical protein C5B47_06115 [Verrucomicrobia bacterium]|nr:MAG: hypothetical protein C5B47_06115 [Verrucomicrobiota bacterium]
MKITLSTHEVLKFEHVPAVQNQELGPAYFSQREGASRKQSFLIQKIATRSLALGKVPPDWNISGKNAPTCPLDLTASQIQELWPIILEMDKTERAHLFSQLSPMHFSLIRASELRAAVPQMTEVQLLSLRPVLSTVFTNDEVKMLWPDILAMSPDARRILIECLQPNVHFSLLEPREIGPVLYQLTGRQIRALDAHSFKQIDLYDIFIFLSSDSCWINLSPEQFRAIWEKIREMEPKDREEVLLAMPPHYLDFLDTDEIGPVLGELSLVQIRRLSAEKVRDLAGWIKKMDRQDRLLFFSALLFSQLILWNPREWHFVRDDFTADDLHNMDLEKSGLQLQKLSPLHIKELFPRLLEIQQSGKRKVFQKLLPRQFELLDGNDLRLLLNASLALESLTNEHIQILWSAIFSLEEAECNALIQRLEVTQLVGLAVEDVLPVIHVFHPRQIKDLWAVTILMNEQQKAFFVQSLSTDQLGGLSAAQIASALPALTWEQSQSLGPYVRNQLKLDLLFGEEKGTSISDVSENRFQKIWPEIVTMPKELRKGFVQQLRPWQLAHLSSDDLLLSLSSMTQGQIVGLGARLSDHLDKLKIKGLWRELAGMERSALRSLLGLLPSDCLSLLEDQELALAIDAMSAGQIQLLAPGTIVALWPKVRMGILSGNSDVIDFCRQLSALQLALLEPDEIPIFTESPESLLQIDLLKISDEQKYCLNAKQVRLMWPNILKLETEFAIKFVDSLQDKQLLELQNAELELLSRSEVSNYLTASQWNTLWLEIVKSSESTRQVFFNKLNIRILSRENIRLLLSSSSAIRQLHRGKKHVLVYLISDMSSLLQPESVQELWSAIRYLTRETRIRLLHQFSVHQLSSLNTRDFSGIGGELTPDQIKSLDQERTLEIAKNISNTNPLDRIYFNDQLSPAQQALLRDNGIVLDNQLTQDELEKIKFEAVPAHQSLLWRPEFLRKLWPQILKVEPWTRKHLLSQLEIHQLSLLNEGNLSSVLSDLPEKHLWALGPDRIRNLWQDVLKLSPVAQSTFLQSLKPGQLALLTANDLLPILGKLHRAQIENLSAEVVQAIAALMPQMEPYDRIYWIHSLLPAQKQQLSLAGITLSGRLTSAEIANLKPDLLSPDKLPLLWPDLRKENRLTEEFVRQLNAAQLYSLEETDLASISEKFTSNQVRLMLPKILRSKEKTAFFTKLRMQQYSSFSLKEVTLVLSEWWLWILQQDIDTRKFRIRQAPSEALQYLNPSEIGPVVNEMTVSQLKPLLDVGLRKLKFEGIWPRTLEMSRTLRKQLFQMFPPEIWPTFIKEFREQILNMEDEKRGSLLRTLSSFLRPQEVRLIWQWMLKLPLKEKLIFEKGFTQLRRLNISEEKPAEEVGGLSACPVPAGIFHQPLSLLA